MGNSDINKKFMEFCQKCLAISPEKAVLNSNYHFTWDYENAASKIINSYAGLKIFDANLYTGYYIGFFAPVL